MSNAFMFSNNALANEHMKTPVQKINLQEPHSKEKKLVKRKWTFVNFTPNLQFAQKPLQENAEKGKRRETARKKSRRQNAGKNVASGIF
jgi:hypothetical protein